jgi:HEAT repeat protein
MTKTAVPPVLLACLLAACASAPSTATGVESLSEAERAEFLAKREAAASAAKTPYERVLILLDQTLDKYAQARMRQGSPTHDALAASLEKYLKNLVTENYDALLRTASDPTYPDNRAKAVAGLGFAHREDALDPLLNALRAEDPIVVRNATFGLGVLASPHTPLSALGDLIEDDKKDRLARIGASWALMQIQPELFEPERTLPIWLRVISRPIGDVDAEILVHSVRSVGALRKPELAPQLEKFVSHPDALLRSAVAVALGRCNNRTSYVALLALIGPAENNANVRLHARKALEQLAGGVSRGYDVAEWRKVFGEPPR